ncbi:hypothetical protein [Streptomyces sp. SID3343]|uniref:hypothetical protein n=1 Tax=Streptomyces sp. SID3343 TaxID=2690260 RepID=UPI00136DD305|nr:hypothetical protein [Streptomyces sp. SID3343]MYW05943.1 hypothetical protein [Streptomyces sp. SID3343]
MPLETYPDLDALQRFGVGAVLSDGLDSVEGFEEADGVGVDLVDFRVSTRSDGAAVLLSVDAPTLESAERTARQMVMGVLEASGILADWRVVRSEVQLHDDLVYESLMAADGPDAPSEDPMLRARGPLPEERARIERQAAGVRAFGLDAFGCDADTAQPDVPEEKARLAAGAVAASVGVLVDLLFTDLVNLRAEDGASFFVLDELPVQEEGFVRRFVVAAVEILGRLSGTGWAPPACFAEEMALRLLVDQGASMLERLGLYDDDVEAAFVTFSDAALEDPDSVELRLSDPGPEAWFEPIVPGRPVHAYLRAHRHEW